MNYEDKAESSKLAGKEKKRWTEKIDFNCKDEKVKKRIIECITNPDNYLGEGGTSMVFNTGEQCIKVIKYRHNIRGSDRYKKGNTPRQELDFQYRVQDLEDPLSDPENKKYLKDSNVFAPVVATYYIGKETAAIIMERLNAVTMQDVLNSKEPLPDKFELTAFFGNLLKFIEAMHMEGIIHGDLTPRNIMIDRVTGSPRIIDFGRSFESKKSEDEEIDLTELDKAKDKMSQFIDKNKNA